MAYNGENSEKITSFTQLRTWQKARNYATYMYRISGKFPNTEIFGLVSQMRRSAVSVAANIAEGFSRSGQKDKAHFYSIALGSLTETLSHSYIALDLGYLEKEDIISAEEQTLDLHKMINGLIKSAQGRTP